MGIQAPLKTAIPVQIHMRNIEMNLRGTLFLGRSLGPEDIRHLTQFTPVVLCTPTARPFPLSWLLLVETRGDSLASPQNRARRGVSGGAGAWLWAAGFG